MKLRFLLATFFMLVSIHARADDADDCVKASGETKITACTRAIESGRWQGADLAWAYTNRGIAKRAKGDLDGAIADHNRALELKPDAYYCDLALSRPGTQRGRRQERVCDEYRQAQYHEVAGPNHRALSWERRTFGCAEWRREPRPQDPQGTTV